MEDKELLSLYNLDSNTKLVTVSFTTDEDWLELRTKGIGGSDIGAIMGLNPYSSPLKIFKQKVEGYKEDLSNNTFVKKGKELENLILTNYVKPYFKNLGYEVGKPDFMIINSDYPFFRANVDGIAFNNSKDYKENIIVEIKWVSEWAEVNWNKPEYNGIPPSYYAQVQEYMLVTGAQNAIVCALFDKDWEMNYFVVPRDEMFISEMINKGRDFYQYNMIMKMPPKLSYELDKKEVAESIKLAPETKVPSAEMTKYVEMYLANGEKIKKAEEVQAQIKDIILDLANKGFCPDSKDHKVKTSVVTSHKFNSSKFKEDNPELYEQYCEDSESPRITIK
jgi:putative phage-type endonuclease